MFEYLNKGKSSKGDMTSRYENNKNNQNTHQSISSTSESLKSNIDSGIIENIIQRQPSSNSSSDDKSLQYLTQRQTENTSNNTGIPTELKRNFEDISGFSFDDVRVHYNSEKPADIQALAYTQGNQIYIGPGQEQHLEHELGHVVQQKMGIVSPTNTINGMPINTDANLEMEADNFIKNDNYRNDTHSNDKKPGNTDVIQRITFEELLARTFREHTERGPEIPRIVHRFWIGGAMLHSDLRELIKLQVEINRVNAIPRQKPWRQILWTSFKINKQKADPDLQLQLQILHDLGVEIRDCGELADEFNKSFVVRHIFKEDEKPDVAKPFRDVIDEFDVKSEKAGSSYKHLSDTARMMALHRFGGVYMDTDIGIGNVDLTAPLRHRDEKGLIPFIGSYDAFGYTEEDYQDSSDEFKFASIMSKYMQKKGGYGWNYFFASAPKNEMILNYALSMIKRGDAQALTVELVDNIMAYAAAMHPDDEPGMQLFKTAMTPWFSLDWYTYGSENKTNPFETNHTFELPTQQRFHYNLFDTAMDGNCFFNAISIAARRLGINITPEILRQIALEHGPENYPENYGQEGVWVDDTAAIGIVNRLGITINVHYVTAQGEYFDTITYGNGGNAIDLVMVAGSNHFTFATQVH